MKTSEFDSVGAAFKQVVSRAFCLLSVAWAGLSGCADTHWERAVYQGARYGSEQCQVKRSPTDAPCAELGDYDRYAQERNRARNATPPTTQAHAIEEKQP
nr:hypothetical protein [Rhodoferax sp.]